MNEIVGLTQLASWRRHLLPMKEETGFEFRDINVLSIRIALKIEAQKDRYQHRRCFLHSLFDLIGQAQDRSVSG